MPTISYYADLLKTLRGGTDQGGQNPGLDTMAADTLEQKLGTALIGLIDMLPLATTAVNYPALKGRA